ncbi:14181_t:CDS:2, partial [Acaulospora colombiana]
MARKYSEYWPSSTFSAAAGELWTSAIVARAGELYATRELHTLGTNDKIPAKMHVRRPGRDNWSYIGRVGVFQELTHKAPVVVVRLQSTDKVVVAFSEHSNISVDKRGNFVVIASVEPSGVVSYSLHAQTNNDALRLLASIELAAYKLGSITGTENRQQTQLRR